MKKIALFDFDGTITTKDTMLELIKFQFGDTGFYRGMLMISPWLIGLKAGWIDSQKAKEKLLSFFFKGMSIHDFEKICRRFSEERLPALIRKEALQKILELQEKHFTIVVVTASADSWVKFWCDKNNLPYLASEMQVLDEKITGKLKGANCNFFEKVNRIKAAYNLEEYIEIHAFGDSSGDKEMLAIATHPFYRKFN